MSCLSTIKLSFSLDSNFYPMLKTLKKKELDKILLKIFDIGYNVYFPSEENIKNQSNHNALIEKIDSIKNELNNYGIVDKIDSLESSLTKLIGIGSNSCKKGNFAENILEDLFKTRYGDIQFERKGHVPHSGDAWLSLPDNKIIMLESKNYGTVVNKDEINKMQSDMINHNIRWGLFISFNSSIQGMKEMDFYTFIHNTETFFIVMISDLSTDIHKLDLGLGIIRKLMLTIGNLPKFPWIVEDISESLNDLAKIIQKNYVMRDSYYTLEQNIQKLLSNHHTILRDYQYDIEKKINEIINKIQETMGSKIISNKIDYQFIHDKYKDKKILPIVVRIIDVLQYKNWYIDYDEDSENYCINFQEQEIGRIKIQQKKAIIYITSNDMTLVLTIGNDKANKQNLNIIKLL